MAILHSRPTMSIQQSCRDISLFGQGQRNHSEYDEKACQRARFLATVILSPSQELELDLDPTDVNAEQGAVPPPQQASSQRRPGTRLWFANQFMIPEQMIGVPHDLTIHEG